MRLSVSFHRTFSLSRPSLSQLLDLAYKNEHSSSGIGLRNADIRKNTNLGSIYVEAMPRYAQAAGLLDEDRLLTCFGRKVCESDIDLLLPETLWIIHYHFMSPVGIIPLYWREYFLEYFKRGESIQRDLLSSVFEERYSGENRQSIAQAEIKAAITVFLGTYSKEDGLGKLNILCDSDGSYSVLEPVRIPLSAFAYILADFWENSWGDISGINLRDLTVPGSLGPMLLLNSGEVNELLGDLAQQGLVEMQRIHPPFQLVRLRLNKEECLDNLYS